MGVVTRLSRQAALRTHAGPAPPLASAFRRLSPEHQAARTSIVGLHGRTIC